MGQQAHANNGVADEARTVIWVKLNTISRKFLAVCLTFAVILSSATVGGAAGAHTGEPVGGPGAAVVIADSGSPGDMGLASSVAGRLRGPLLLTDNGSLGWRQLRLISSLRPDRVVIVGNRDTIDSTIAEDLHLYLAGSDYQVERIEGTSLGHKASIAMSGEFGYVDSSGAVLVNGSSTADVAAASVLVSLTHQALLFVERDSIGQHSSDVLSLFNPSEITIVGGSVAISEKVEQELSDIEGVESVVRKFGPDRISTALDTKQAWGISYRETLVIADGWSDSSVAVGASMAAVMRAGFLVRPSHGLGDVLASYVNTYEPQRIIFVGTPNKARDRINRTLDGLYVTVDEVIWISGNSPGDVSVAGAVFAENARSPRLPEEGPLSLSPGN